MPSVHVQRPQWKLQAPDPGQVDRLCQSLGVPRLLAVLLANRGFEADASTRQHLAPNLQDLHDPFLLPDMEAACERLQKAVENQHTILVHGDYDVDGVTGTALLVKLLRHLGADVAWHIPSRFEDGYSFGEHSLRKAAEVGAQVVVSVDNGTSSTETIASLAGMGVQTIVTDHHEPPLGELPPAIAIVNPKLATSTYPFRELCGAAVAFKLAWGLCQKMSGGGRVRDDLREFLVDAMGLVAIATVCDVVPLEKENRILAHYGLKALGASKSPGIRALLEVTQLAGKPLTAEDVGFQIGPRINAAGRLDSAARAVEVFLAEEATRARQAAQTLDQLNQERRSLERTLTAAALELAEPFGQDPACPVIVVGEQGWHPGLIGIVAARLVDRFQKPAIVFGFDGEQGRGSARSVPGFSILDAMHGASDWFPRYGGHAQAAGCDACETDLPVVRKAICDRAEELLQGEGLPTPTLEIDADLPLAEMVETQMRVLDRLRPFGQGNREPVLLSRDVRLAEPPRQVGGGGEHLMLRVRQGEVVHPAIFFGQGARAAELEMGQPLQVVYTPRWNTFRGETRLQLLVKDLHPGDGAPLTR